MTVFEKVMGFAMKYEKNAVNEQILMDASAFQLWLFLRLGLALMLTKFLFNTMGESFDLSFLSFLWVKSLAVYFVPYLIGLLHFRNNPATGLATIQTIAILNITLGLFIAVASGMLIGYFGIFIISLPLDIYLFIKSRSLRRNFCTDALDSEGIFWRIIVISGLVAVIGSYLALRLHFFGLEYVNAKGEIVEIAGLISPDSRYIARGNDISDFSSVREVGRRKITHHYIDTPLEIQSEVFSPDSKYLALAGSPRKDQNIPGIAIAEVEKVLANERMKVPLGFAPTELKLSFPHDLLENNGVLGIAFSPNGKYFACETEKAVILWELGTGKTFKLLTRDSLYHDKFYSKVETQITFSADSKRLLTSATRSGKYTDGKVLIWDIESKQLFKTIDIGQITVAKIKFSPDGNRLAILLQGVPYGKLSQYQGIPEEAHNVVVLWNIEAGQIERYIYDKDGGHGYIEIMDYSPDGKYIATAIGDNYLVTIWDAATGKRIKVLRTHLNSYPQSLTYSPDGQFLEVASGGIITERWKRDGF